VRVGGHAGDNGRQVVGEGRHVHAHVLQGAEHAVILNGMVRRAHDAVAAAVADQLVEVAQTHVVADLLERRLVHEGGDAVAPTLLAYAGRIRRDADHILLGDAGVDESFAHGALERLKRHETEIPRKEDEGLRGAQCDQRGA
jgi:hypothetical protein